MKIDCFLIYLTRGLVVINIDSLELYIWIAVVATESVDSMFIWNHLPKLEGKIEEQLLIRQRRRRRQRQRQKSTRFYKGNKNFRHVHHTFLHISLPSLHEYDMKLPFFSRLCRSKTDIDRIFFLLLNLDMVLSSVLWSELQGACLYLTKWVGIIVVLSRLAEGWNILLSSWQKITNKATTLILIPSFMAC